MSLDLTDEDHAALLRLVKRATDTIESWSDVGSLFDILWQKGTLLTIMLAFGQTRLTNDPKRSNDFRCPERARISWGKAMRGRGPGEGPNRIALGAATHRCAPRT